VLGVEGVGSTGSLVSVGIYCVLSKLWDMEGVVRIHTGGSVRTLVE
jgi:hypothetical protein